MHLIIGGNSLTHFLSMHTDDLMTLHASQFTVNVKPAPKYWQEIPIAM